VGSTKKDRVGRETRDRLCRKLQIEMTLAVPWLAVQKVGEWRVKARNLGILCDKSMISSLTVLKNKLNAFLLEVFHCASALTSPINTPRLNSSVL